MKWIFLLIKSAYNFCFAMKPFLTPSGFREQMVLAEDRQKAFRYMANLVGMTNSVKGVTTVLYDGMWNNPNYWLRLSLIRAALGLSHTHEIGVVGRYHAKSARSNFRSLGIRNFTPFRATRDEREAALSIATELIDNTDRPEAILSWRLPEELPGDVIYDGLLKRQRGAVVDLNHSSLKTHVTEAIAGIFVASRILREASPQIVLASHTIEFSYGVLVWVAVQRGIPVILLFGQLGVLRFVKISSSKDFYDFMDCAGKDEIADLEAEKSASLEKLGSHYLEQRLSGKHGDLGSVYAYRNRTTHIDRKQIADCFSWDANKPIVSVYASNWFDYPHGLGMSNFRDFLDWIEVTIEAAGQNTDVQWLFKAHPCDEWYGGVTLEDLVSFGNFQNLQMTPKDWSGLDIINCSDALVTVHSTAAIEFAAMHRPVLVADKGWYDECGFSKLAQSRQDYISLLKTDWWKNTDIKESARLAKIFAGLYFGRPQWQDKFVQLDDSSGEKLYRSQIRFFEKSNKELTNEISCLRNWYLNHHKKYHTYKMLNNFL